MLLIDAFGSPVVFQSSSVAFVPVKAGNTTKYAQVDLQDLPCVIGYKWTSQATSGGYAARGHKDKKTGKSRTTGMHRQILGLVPGDEKVVDHANHDPLDNRRSNIRITDPFGNMQNVIAGYGASGIRGAYKHTDRVAKGKVKWKAIVRHRGKAHYAGTFDTAEEAGRAAAAKREELSFLGPAKTSTFAT